MQENNFKVNPHSLKTAVSRVEKDKIVTRGYNQRDLIEKIRYSDMIFLLLRGRLPTLKEARIFNHVLVSFCDHGVTPPSTQTARLIASSGSPLNSAVAGALLSFGHKHAGAIEKTMELYQSKISTARLIDDPDIDNKQIASLAIEVYKDYVLKGKKVPGFGHRYHSTDPRADKLIEMAIKEGFIGPHLKLALAIQDLVFEAPVWSSKQSFLCHKSHKSRSVKHQNSIIFRGRIFQSNRQINHRIAFRPVNVRKYKQKRSVRL